MKSIVFSDFISMFRRHKLVFFVLLLSIACSFLVFSMMTGVVNYRINQFKMTSSFHTFSIDLDNKTLDNTEESVKNLIENENLRTLFLAKTSLTEPLIVGWHGRNDDRWFVLDEGRFFEEQDEDNNNVAVVSQKIYPTLAFEESKQSFTIDGNTFEIIGVAMSSGSQLFIYANDLYQKYYPDLENTTYEHNDNSEHCEHEDNCEYNTPSNEIKYPIEDINKETIIIPINAFLNFEYIPNIIRLEYYIADERELEQTYYELSVLFPNAIIHKPILPEEFLAKDMISAIMKSVAIIICAFVNIIALYIYWLICQKRIHSIYLLCGARKVTIIKLILTEWGILMLLGYVLFVCLQSIIAPIITLLSVKLVTDIWKHLLLFLFLYLVTTIMIIPQVKKNININIEVI